jgi:iron complex transport system ATP-binding protein
MTLQVESVWLSRGNREILQDATINLSGTELVGLVGRNGAGKSTLLQAIAGLLPTRGSIRWRRKDVAAMPLTERARTIAYLDQRPEAHWGMRVWDFVALGRLPHGNYVRRIADADMKIVDETLRQTATLHVRNRRVDALSGGELARVQLARALSVKAPLLLVDEPVAQLDPYHQLQIMSILRENAREGAMIIAVLHDLTLAARFCDTIVLLDGGRISEVGLPHDVLTSETLQSAYSIEPLIGSHESEPYIVPWRRSSERLD